ncbi:MAG: hypothetical protein GQ532_18260 [Methylomarinum sp.]|nr:hypothetical protein [Methylomarinum sp.]
MGKETTFDDDLLTAKQIAGAADVDKSTITRRIKTENIPTAIKKSRGGAINLVAFNDLPADLKAAVQLKHGQTERPAVSEKVQALLDAEEETRDQPLKYTVDWSHYDKKTAAQKSKAAKKLLILRELKLLLDYSGEKKKVTETMQRIADKHEMSEKTLKNWWYGRKGKPGVIYFDEKDWPAVLVNCHTGRRASGNFSQEAFDWFSSFYLHRSKPSLKDSYRRTEEIAEVQGWIMPSEKTMERYMKDQISAFSRVFFREGEVAARKLHPFQHRDKTCFKAGEAVTGDGLKFDRVWVEFPDGEIINTATGWFWQDIYSGKILAYRLDKTENTDVFRLATYDLTALCTPYYVQVDNTRVAANKAMTGQAKGRHRFKDLPTDPMGILLHLGMDVHFTNPDHKVSNPGVKPIERAFGIGGIHEKVATNTQLRDRGFSRKTAIPFDEFRKIVADEVVRHNAQKKRRSDVCQGIYSFDEAFSRSFATAAPRISSEEQRRLLLKMPEQVRAAKDNGVISIKAGRSSSGRNRYYCDELIEYGGQELVVFYDPQNLHGKVNVYSMDNRYLFDAEWMPSVAFNDQSDSREYFKNDQRRRKSAKLMANAEKCMDNLDLQKYVPEKRAAETPTADVITGKFENTLKMPEAVSVDQETGEVINAESLFGKAAEQMEEVLQRKLAEEI